MIRHLVTERLKACSCLEVGCGLCRRSRMSAVKTSLSQDESIEVTEVAVAPLTYLNVGSRWPCERLFNASMLDLQRGVWIMSHSPIDSWAEKQPDVGPHSML